MLMHLVMFLFARLARELVYSSTHVLTCVSQLSFCCSTFCGLQGSAKAELSALRASFDTMLTCSCNCPCFSFTRRAIQLDYSSFQFPTCAVSCEDVAGMFVGLRCHQDPSRRLFKFLSVTMLTLRLPDLGLYSSGHGLKRHYACTCIKVLFNKAW